MEKLYHIDIPPGSLGKYAFLPGDPGRCPQIAAHFEHSAELAFNREFRTIAGTIDGERVCVTSTGIGGPSAVIAMEELYMAGVRTFIRIGTCGGIALQVCAGDIVIATGAVRQEGTGREYVPIEFPAVADFSLVRALDDAARDLGLKRHTGVVQCKDSFYGQHSPERMPAGAELLEKWEAWKRAGALASEMESAALFCCAASLGARCASVFSVVWNQERRAAGLTDSKNENTQNAALAAISAMKAIIKDDKLKPEGNETP